MAPPPVRLRYLWDSQTIIAVGPRLWLRVAMEPKAYGGDPFRIKWAQLGADGKKGLASGVSKTCPDEASARAAYKAAVKHALDQGWKQVEIAVGLRRLELKPIPAPKKRAA